MTMLDSHVVPAQAILPGFERLTATAFEMWPGETLETHYAIGSEFRYGGVDHLVLAHQNGLILTKWHTGRYDMFRYFLPVEPVGRPGKERL